MLLVTKYPLQKKFPHRKCIFFSAPVPITELINRKRFGVNISNRLPVVIEKYIWKTCLIVSTFIFYFIFRNYKRNCEERRKLAFAHIALDPSMNRYIILFLKSRFSKNLLWYLSIYTNIYVYKIIYFTVNFNNISGQ